MFAWAIDLDGVVWRGDETVAGAPEAIAHLRQAGAPLAFVTNSALRTPKQVGEKLIRAYTLSYKKDKLVVTEVK